MKNKKTKIIQHIIKEGSRKHVISYDMMRGKHCSEPNCEINFSIDEILKNKPIYEPILEY